VEEALTSNANGHARPAIEVVDVSKQFEQDNGQIVTVFENINVTVQPGEFVSLLGPSGCGKSTLLRVCAGLIPATSGTVTFDGEPVRKPPAELGMVFQEDSLLEWRTVLKNVLLAAEIKDMPMSEAKPRALELLERTGLGEFADARPSQLSGGMKQRASICQALLHKPQLLLMDEPFGALDALTREQMQSDLQELWAQEKSTVLFVTHSISEAVLLSDRVLVFSKRPARIVADLHVNLPRPRMESATSEPEFQRLTGEIHTLFRKEGILK
jgi:NitT/TauT family transport system ATP-binding protein